MALPEPCTGLIIRYGYLWAREHAAGFEEGRKDRPCAIVLVAGSGSVIVLPITHVPPHNSADGVEIPLLTKQRLGLDGDRSWIVVTEANQFSWPGPDVRPLPERGHAALLPAPLFRIVQETFLAAYRTNKAKLVRRTE